MNAWKVHFRWIIHAVGLKSEMASLKKTINCMQTYRMRDVMVFYLGVIVNKHCDFFYVATICVLW